MSAETWPVSHHPVPHIPSSQDIYSIGLYSRPACRTVIPLNNQRCTVQGAFLIVTAGSLVLFSTAVYRAELSSYSGTEAGTEASTNSSPGVSAGVSPGFGVINLSSSNAGIRLVLVGTGLVLVGASLVLSRRAVG